MIEEKQITISILLILIITALGNSVRNKNSCREALMKAQPLRLSIRLKNPRKKTKGNINVI